MALRSPSRGVGGPGARACSGLFVCMYWGGASDRATCAGPSSVLRCSRPPAIRRRGWSPSRLAGERERVRLHRSSRDPNSCLKKASSGVGARHFLKSMWYQCGTLHKDRTAGRRLIITKRCELGGRASESSVLGADGVPRVFKEDFGSSPPLVPNCRRYAGVQDKYYLPGSCWPLCVSRDLARSREGRPQAPRGPKSRIGFLLAGKPLLMPVRASPVPSVV